MNKYSYILLFLFLVPAAAVSQVDNYALKLSDGGNVNFRQINGLNGLASYTLQFWMNPSDWAEGAAIFSRGAGAEEFSVRLGEPGSVIFKAGNHQVTAMSEWLIAGNWSQLTLVNNFGNIAILLNNEQLVTSFADMVIPSSAADFITGGDGFSGYVDELRIWGAAIDETFFHLWRNTVNKHHPNWEDLLVYYKFDQNLCDHIVDYKFSHHGILSGSGAARELVTDNPFFKYRTSVGYTDFGRWADRQIDEDKYLLTNDLIILGLSTDASGKVKIPYPYNEGSVVNGGYLSEYEGRSGVLSLNGDGAFMNVGSDVLNPGDKYSFSTWIYLEQWTEGAYIFRKEKSDTEGFSIRLGNEDQKRIIVRVNGVDYSRINQMVVNEWIHLGVAAYSTTKNQVYQISFNGSVFYATNNAQEENDYRLSGLSETPAYIGFNIHAKLDETVVWNAYRNEGHMQQAMTDTPMPSATRLVEAQTLYATDSYWNYNDASNVGYDAYSYKHFISVMRSHYKGYRGYKIRMSFHNFPGWENSFADPLFRQNFAEGVAQAAQELDGIDLDFEWCYTGACWDNYGKVIEEIKAVFPADKLLTVTPHYVSYGLPVKYMEHVDYFPFQIYGPGKHVFLWSTYLDALTRFRNHGYANDKIVLSYATTTSRAYDAISDQEYQIPPIGVRNGLLDGGYTPDMNSVIDVNGYRRYITGYNQVIDRCEFIHDHDLKGIMYWDMGNDVKTSHPYSLVKAAAFSLNSNVDTLVTQVDLNPTSIGKKPILAPELRIVPNPARELVNVTLPSEEGIRSLELIDFSGRVIRTDQHTTILNVSNVSAGNYVVKATALSGRSFTSKLQIQ